MRSIYPELFARSDTDVRHFVTDATVVLDANVLLGLYRLSSDARENAIEVLEAPSVGGRLWLPYQAGLEFVRNRARVAGALDDAYNKARRVIDEIQAKTAGAFDTGERHKRSREAVIEVVKGVVANLKAELEQLRTSDEARIDPDDDPILPRIERLLAHRTGSPPSPNLVQERIQIFNSYRAPNLIPPGFDDIKSKVGADTAGDYLIWAEILDLGATSDKPVLFLTDDLKNDWYDGPRGRRTGPRPELIREFAHYSSNGYHQLGFARFLDLAREHLLLDVDETTVDEVTEAAEAAEAETQGHLSTTEKQTELHEAIQRRTLLQVVENLKPEASGKVQLALEGLEPAEPPQARQRSIVDELLDMLSEE
jgi:hypothetical protein